MVDSRPTVVELTACMRRPSEETVFVVDRILGSVRLSGAAADAPTTAPE